jgi:HAD superfamily hydrolase (TIGR01509 family)
VQFDVAEIAAVLWDMDGTLVDTEPYWIEREHEIVREHGNGAWTDDHAHALVGFDLRDSARYISLHGGIDLPVDDIVNLLLDGVIERVHRRTPWRPGARELLAEINAAGIPCALVTMSWKRFAEAVIPALPEGSFTAIVAGDDVSNGKPHPEPYLAAAALLDVPPHRCIAIEDSPTGVRSAVAAGCVTIGVPHVVDVPDSLGGHRLSTLEGVRLADLADLMSASQLALE